MTSIKGTLLTFTHRPQFITSCYSNVALLKFFLSIHSKSLTTIIGALLYMHWVLYQCFWNALILLHVTRDSREPVGCMYIERDLCGIGSCNYGDWQFPISAVSNSETEEHQCCSSSPNAGRPKTQEEPVFHLESEGRKKVSVPIQGSQAGRIPLMCKKVGLFIQFRPSTDWMRTTHIWEGDLLNTVYRFQC